MTQKYFLLTVLLIALTYSAAYGQKNGFRGYGSIDNVYLLDNPKVSSYISGGGGIIVNNNIYFGLSVGSFLANYKTKIEALSSEDPATKDDFLFNSFDENNDSIYNISESMSMRDISLSLGLNLRPKKNVQCLLGIKTGPSLFRFEASGFIIKTDGILVRDYNIGAFGWHFIPQAEMVLKVGSSIKLKFIGGYRLLLNYSKSPWYPEQQMIHDKSLLNGGFLGMGISMGNF